MKRLLPLVAVTAIGLWSVPAAAQDADTKINMIYIEEGEECPQSTPDMLTVCGELEEPYRIPKALRQSSDPANESWSNRVQAFRAVGDFGPLSCSPVGAGGELGCLTQIIDAAYAEKATAPGIRAAELIAQARGERLALIDAEAAETQARVEELEREYAERLEREEAGEAPPLPPAGGPVVVNPADIRD